MGRTAQRVAVGAAGVAMLVAVLIALPSGEPSPNAARIAAAVRPLTGDATPTTPIPTTARPPVTVSALPPLPGGTAAETTGAGLGSPTTAPTPTASTTRSASTSPTAAPTRSTTARTHPLTTRRSPAGASSSPTDTATGTTQARATRPPATPATTRATRTAPTTTAPRTTTAARTTAPPRPHFGIPVTIGNAGQIVTVTATSSSATTGTLRAWQKGSDGTWSVALGPYPAWLGSQGIGQQSEYVSRTPLGTFTLTQAFGRLGNPGTALPYHRTNPDDWWVSDVHSPEYNTLQNCAPSACPFDTSVSERLYYITPEYDYAVVMDVNRSPVVPGAGSAFFLHVTDHQPTAGCVAIDPGNLLAVMRWLRPSAHPRIATSIT